MKTLVFCFLFLVSSFAFSQSNRHESLTSKSAGDHSVLFGFGGFSEMTITNINKGLGIRYWLVPDMSGRATLGFSHSTDNEDNKEVSISAAVLKEIGATENTSVYIGPSLAYYHESNQLNLYTFAGVMGAEFYPWHNISFGAEYQLLIAARSGFTSVQFGETAGNVTISVAF